MEHEAVARAGGVHSPARGAAAAQELEQVGLDLVVGVVGEDEVGRAELARDLSEEAVARGAGVGFAHFVFAAGAVFAGDELEAEMAGEIAHGDGVGGAFLAPAVVEMEDDGLAARGDERVEERDGIDAAGDGGEQREVGQCGERGFAGRERRGHGFGLSRGGRSARLGEGDGFTRRLGGTGAGTRGFPNGVWLPRVGAGARTLG